MAGGCRTNSPAVKKTAVDEKVPDKDYIGEDSVIVVDDSSLESEIAELRGRWELASVFNFLSVFEPLIGSDLKLTAEEIETGLVTPNGSLAQLHIKLLKGIPPVSKTLNGSDAWVTVLCKKIALWWPWVAEGEMPLTVANGKEISRYKELDPTDRLRILKALCEIRADQDDAVSYINETLKNGTEISCFRKDKIGEDGNITSYWCDGSAVIGHRLYKEVKKTEPKSKMKGKASNNLPSTSLQWETLATNLKEFREVVDELSSSKVAGEIAVGKTIETNFLPVVEKFQKKKERALKQKQRQERLLNDFRSYETGITRTCRSHRSISYTFDEYDRAIDEAIEISKKRKKEQRNEKKHSKLEKLGSDGADLRERHFENGDSEVGTDSKDENIKNSDSETQSDRIQQDTDGDGDGDDDDDDDDDYDCKSSNNEDGNESGKSGEEKDILSDRNCSQKPAGTRWSKRLAGVMNNPVTEIRNLATKNRLRQRLTHNSAVDPIVLDSEDENFSENTNG
ncbi:hypothetical protein P3X46_007303 [Hevea brasiliensis]|uniref:DDT domain-containing protein n=1 Tax=Hevea brasiliensis TaxID=3981 RepID=A0ABQ9MT34_HEVBR|nr:DDT domain-containing protein DDR4 [Hevea brasiliensis]KAJ9183452.1 hypothetical protein P3X46_007303 [Hevea brasiliensis]